MPTNDNAISAALVLDTSASMSYSGYVDITKIDSKAFINCARAGDKIAVCNYDTNGNTPFAIAEVTDSNSVITDAANIIQNLSFNGNSTNIAAGLDQGIAQLNPQTTSRGLVLLSDGYNNAGPGPLSVPPPPYPIFACAMGPNSDQGLMQQIAARTTNGQYYYAPKVVDMMKIYNQIRALNPQTQAIANQLNSIPEDYYELVPATVSQGNSEAQFVVAWTNTALTYTSGNPSSTALSITLVDPNNNTTSYTPTYIGSGYVVFNVPSPLVGTWHAQVLYGSGSSSLPVTVGVFEFQHDPSQVIALQVEAPQIVEAGAPISLNAHVTHGIEKLSNVSIHAEITKPKISLNNALKRYKGEYEQIKLTNKEAGNMPEDVQKLAVLHQSWLPDEDILAHSTSIQHLAKDPDTNIHSTVIRDTGEAGSYNLHLTVKGTSHLNGSEFQRSHLLTVLVK